MYKLVLVIGPNLLENFVSLQQIYNHKETIIIGDGQHAIQGESLEVLKGNINHDTRIDINIHGMEYYVNDNHTIKHASLYCDVNKFALTEVLFKKLASMNPDTKLNIHLWSCYGELAQHEFEHLPQGSILITHIPSNLSASPTIEEFIILKSISEKSFIISLYDFISPLSVSLISDHKQTTIATAIDIDELLENPRKSLEKQVNSFGQSFPFLGEYKINEEDVNNYFIGQIMHACRSMPNDLMNKLKELTTTSQIDKLINHRLNGFSLILEASALGNIDIVEFLLEHKDNPNKLYHGTNLTVSPLYFAIHNNPPSEDLFYLLKNHGADLNIPISSRGDSVLHNAVINNNIKAVKLLIKEGISIDLAREFDGATPLMIASQENKYKIAEILLEHHANVNAQNYKLGTPLILAVASGYTSIVELLLKYNADTKLCLEDGFNALMIAEEKQYTEIINILGKVDSLHQASYVEDNI